VQLPGHPLRCGGIGMPDPRGCCCDTAHGWLTPPPLARPLWWALALGQTAIERPADHARICRLRVPQLPGLVDRLAGQAEVRHLGRRNLVTLLRGVVLIRQPALGLRLDLQGISLGPVRGRYQIVVRPLGLGGVIAQERTFNLNFSRTCAVYSHGLRPRGFALCEPRQRLGAPRAFVVSKQLYFTPS
jgi:hypothetical protein